MSIAARPLTYEDLCRAREDGNRYELIEGELILVAAPSPWHQRVSRRLFMIFESAVGETGLGEVFYAPLDVRFADGSVVQPDLVVVLADRSQIVEATLIEGAPSVLVEISSPSSRAIDRERKARVYARNGVPEYWHVDADDCAIIVHAEPAGERFARIEQMSERAQSVVLPGLTVDLDTVFSGLPEIA